MILINCEAVPMRKIPNGETLEIESDIVDYADNAILEAIFIAILAIFVVDV
jgi:hypothetical protein